MVCGKVDVKVGLWVAFSNQKILHIFRGDAKSESCVVYFDQHVHAGLAKGWLKYAFVMFFCVKKEANEG